MVKTIRVNIESTFDYIEMFNGFFKLSHTELQILAAFVDLYNETKSVGINVFSAEMKKKVAEALGREDFNTLNNYIKILSEKGAIRKQEVGYSIHPMLIPQGENEVRLKFAES